MCQVAVISQNIVNLGTRSYKHSLMALVPGEYRVSQLKRLNHDLDAFYELLYSQCNTITEREYRVFEKQFDSMLKTLIAFYALCEKMPKEYGMSHEAEKLKMNYGALYELNNDIKNYRIKALKDSEWTTLLSEANVALKNIVHG